MLSRRFLRIKVLQAIYAYHQEGSGNIPAGEKQLLKSLDKLYELYIHQLGFILAIHTFASRRIEDAKQKYLPTEEDLNPNMRFVENPLLLQFNANRELTRLCESYHLNWHDEDDLLRKIYNLMRDHEGYQAYMKAPACSYNDHKKVIGQVLLLIMSESELLRSYYEEKNIYWAEDFDISVMMVDKTIAAWRESWDEFRKMPTLLKDENDPGGSDDLNFLKQLFRKSIIHDEEYNQVIAARASNWELDRIALMDMIILKMAITELVEFPSIPVKVSLNEYIELAKEYSTPKSKLFINGILDKLIAEYKQSGKIVKTGRGLME